MRVIYPGPFTTVQDNGRYGHQSEGFIVSGCADSESMKIANILWKRDLNFLSIRIKNLICRTKTLLE